MAFTLSKKNTRLYSIVSVALLCAIFTFLNFSVKAEVWTLERCLLYALENNIQIRQASFNEQVAKSNEWQSLLQMVLPRVSGDINLSQNFGRSIDPTINQFVTQRITANSLSGNIGLTLFNGLSQWYNIKQNKMTYAASEADKANANDNVALTVTRSFLQVLLSKEQLKSSEAQLALSNNQLAQAISLVETGNAPLGNQLDADAQLAQDSVNYLIAFNGLRVAKLSLQVLLQLEPEESFDVEAPLMKVDLNPSVLNETPEIVYQTALENQHNIQAAKYRIESARYRMKSAKGLQYPVLTGFFNMRANYSTGFKNFSTIENPNRTDTLGFIGGNIPITIPSRTVLSENINYFDQLDQNLSKTVGISLNIPILNGWQARNAIKISKINYQIVMLQHEQATNQLKQDVYTAFYDAQNAMQTYLAAQKSIAASQKALEYNQDRYELGAINALQYNISRTNFANAEIQAIRSKYDYVFKLKVLDFYKGNPIQLN